MASSAKRMKFLLPIKTKKGLVLQTREEVDADREAELVEDEPDDTGNVQQEAVSDLEDEDAAQLTEGQIAGLYGDDEQVKNLSPVEQLALEEAQAKEMKISIANYAQGAIEDPQNHVGHLRHLRLMLASPLCRSRPVLADCIVVSLCEVFKDILPSYRIRVTTDAEKTQMAKKETKRLRAFEESLLLNYRKYLGVLHAAMRRPGAAAAEEKAKRCKWRRKHRRDAEVVYTNRSLAIRCLGQLLGAHPNFNESEELIDWLTPCLNSRSPVDSASAAAAFRQLFADDRSGEAALRAVKSVCRYAGGLAPNKVHGELLEVLASVRLDLPPPQARHTTGDDNGSSSKSFATMTHKQKQAQLSRQQRRQGKRSASDDRDLAELRFQESAAVRARRQQRCAELLLHLYVRVLRARPLGARPLTASLAGLNRLALRVNLDLLPDLFNALGALLEWPDLSAENSLLVVSTALSLLTGEGESLTLDPRRFYLHLYARLDRVIRNHPELAPRLCDTLRLALADRRRHLPPTRPVSFLRRLVDACCLAKPPVVEAALTELLGCAARLFAVFPRARHLLEPADMEDAGLPPPARLALLPSDGADPDLCPPGAAATCQPALRRLSVDHPSQAVRQLAARLLRLDFAVPALRRSHQQSVAPEDGEEDDSAVASVDTTRRPAARGGSSIGGGGKRKRGGNFSQSPGGKKGQQKRQKPKFGKRRK